MVRPKSDKLQLCGKSHFRLVISKRGMALETLPIWQPISPQALDSRWCNIFSRSSKTITHSLRTRQLYSFSGDQLYLLQTLRNFHEKSPPATNFPYMQLTYALCIKIVGSSCNIWTYTQTHI